MNKNPLVNKKLMLCTGGDCAGKGSQTLLRDIEETCPDLKIVAASCFKKDKKTAHLCGRGPVLQVLTRVKGDMLNTSIEMQDVNNWKSIEELMKKHVGFSMSKIAAQVGKLKFEARRATDPAAFNDCIDKAFGILSSNGGTQKNSNLASQLHVLRARDLVKKDPKDALHHAEVSARLTPGWAAPAMVSCLAKEALGLVDEAWDAFRNAENIGGKGLDYQESLDVKQRLEQKIKDIKAEEDETKRVKAEERSRQVMAETPKARVKTEIRSGVRTKQKPKNNQKVEAALENDSKERDLAERVATAEASDLAAAKQDQSKLPDEDTSTKVALSATIMTVQADNHSKQHAYAKDETPAQVSIGKELSREFAEASEEHEAETRVVAGRCADDKGDVPREQAMESFWLDNWFSMMCCKAAQSDSMEAVGTIPARQI